MFRKPTQIERLYIDFDCFFASVEQQLQPQLRGYPVGVLPFMSRYSCVIAPSREAKCYGVKTGMRVKEVLQLCPDIKFVPARHDAYVRLHQQIYQIIEDCIHIDQACSIDEVVCTLLGNERNQINELAQQIRKTLMHSIGPYITCSMGFAPNRLLAKIAADVDKPEGTVIWNADNFSNKLFTLELQDIPGIGRGMSQRLEIAGIKNTKALWQLPMDSMRKIWGSVEGERFWYSLHGYAVEPISTSRCMFGHSRILTPENRVPEKARLCARLLTVKAARRLRRANFLASGFSLSLRFENKTKWSNDMDFAAVADDHTFLTALAKLWSLAMQDYEKHKDKYKNRIKHISISIHCLATLENQQPDLFTNQIQPPYEQQKWNQLALIMDEIVKRYGSKAVSLGIWEEPPGGYAGAKIAFGRIPNLADF
ncbi:MAG: type VI secretion protein ImpB [Proteobacteria bacterium]|nr:type VI secretion protein ImpB [Pseudomonadota bacterium]